MNLEEYIAKKVVGMLGLLRYNDGNEEERLGFINDRKRIIRTKIKEYNVWYEGDDDELLHFYTHENMIGFNYEPYYNRNKINYFWSISSTETDVKRTHSGHPRNVVDTLVNIIGESECSSPGETTNDILQRIIEDNDMMSMISQEQIPYTLVEGWGAFKINWNFELSDTPVLMYYKANDVNFIYKSNRLVGIIFKDYYTDIKGKQYLIVETRHLGKEDGAVHMYIEKELFEVSGNEEWIKKVPFKSVPELAHIKTGFKFSNYNRLLAEPSIFFKDKKDRFGDMPGKSIYCGKLSTFDDIDQCWSQLANTVRKSTPVEYIDVNMLERDKKTGMPIQPKAYDRKYTKFIGGKNSDGEANGEPVHVTQPKLEMDQFVQVAGELLRNSISGILSPATLGLDVAKRDNADAQREKEKVTIFTRNAIIKKEIRIIKSILEQCMHAYEFMRTGKLTVRDYDITVKFGEFADDSYDNKLAVLGAAYEKGIISPEMLVSRLYSGEELSDADRQKEIDYIKENSREPFAEGFAPDGNPLGGAVPPVQDGGEFDEDEDSEDI